MNSLPTELRARLQSVCPDIATALPIVQTAIATVEERLAEAPPADFEHNAYCLGELRERQIDLLLRARDHLAGHPTASVATTEPLQLVARATIDASGTRRKRPTVSILAYTGGLIRVGWSRPVVLDLVGIRLSPRIAILLDHMLGQIVGQGVAKRVGPDKLIVTGTITGPTEGNTPAGRVVTHSKNGFVWAASVGVGVERAEPIGQNERVTVNGREFNGPIHVVRAGRLGEVSFVGVGADEGAYADVAAKR